MKSKFTTHKGNEDIVQMAQISSQTKNLKKKYDKEIYCTIIQYLTLIINRIPTFINIGINTNVSQTFLKLQNLSIFVAFVSNPCQY